MKAVQPIIPSHGIPLPPNEVGRIAEHVRKGGNRKEGTCCPWSRGLRPKKL